MLKIGTGIKDTRTASVQNGTNISAVSIATAKPAPTPLLNADIPRSLIRDLSPAPGHTALYISTSLEKAKRILNRGFIASRSGTRISDRKVEKVTGTDQTTARSITIYDRYMENLQKLLNGSWYKLWGSIKDPTTISKLEHNFQGSKVTPEVTFVVEVPADQLKKPDLWKYIIQPSARYLTNTATLPPDKILKIIAHDDTAFSELKNEIGAKNMGVLLQRSNISENANTLDGAKFSLNVAAFLTPPVVCLGSGIAGLFCKILGSPSAFLSSMATISWGVTMLYLCTVPDWKRFGIGLIKFLRDENASSLYIGKDGFFIAKTPMGRRYNPLSRDH